jgi:CheY-like chemotaxis protein
MPLNTERPRVLVIDDLPENREVVIDLLNTFGITEVIGSDDVQARETFWAFRPDVVIADVAMPVEDGTQIAAWIRKVAPSVRVVIYTAFTNVGRIKLAIDAVEAHAFLQKPFDALDLYKAVTGE